MMILVTGASGNVGKGMIERLKAARHELVLHDLGLLPEGEPFTGLPFVQCGAAPRHRRGGDESVLLGLRAGALGPADQCLRAHPA